MVSTQLDLTAVALPTLFFYYSDYFSATCSPSTNDSPFLATTLDNGISWSKVAHLGSGSPVPTFHAFRMPVSSTAATSFAFMQPLASAVLADSWLVDGVVVDSPTASSLTDGALLESFDLTPSPSYWIYLTGATLGSYCSSS